MESNVQEPAVPNNENDQPSIRLNSYDFSGIRSGQAEIKCSVDESLLIEDLKESALAAGLSFPDDLKIDIYGGARPIDKIYYQRNGGRDDFKNDSEFYAIYLYDLRGNIIFMNTSIIFADLREKTAQQLARKLAHYWLHESTHLLQRHNPTLFYRILSACKLPVEEITYHTQFFNVDPFEKEARKAAKDAERIAKVQKAFLPVIKFVK